MPVVVVVVVVVVLLLRLLRRRLLGPVCWGGAVVVRAPDAPNVRLGAVLVGHAEAGAVGANVRRQVGALQAVVQEAAERRQRGRRGGGGGCRGRVCIIGP